MMSDLDDAFRAFRTETLARVRPAGMVEARVRYGRRRRRRAATLALLVVLAVAVPIAAYMVSMPPGRGPYLQFAPPAPISATPVSRVPVLPIPVPSSPSDAGTRTNRGSEGFCPPALYAAPAGGLTRTQLCNGTIDVPPWPPQASELCASGRLTFTDGVHWTGVYPITFGPEYGTWYTPIYYTDVDHDGAVDTVVTMNCWLRSSEVVVLKPAPGGGITMFARLAVDGVTIAGQEIAVTASGDIQVFIGHWRTFAWTGTGFVEVSGVPAPSGSALPPSSQPGLRTFPAGPSPTPPVPAPVSTGPDGAPISPSPGR